MKDTLYDPNNIFAKIIRGEIACKKLFNLLDKKTTKVSKFSDNIFE